MEEKEIESEEEKKDPKESLIESILEIKRQKDEEDEDETPEVKLGRRLEQRSYRKLSKQILDHIITRYEIDYNKLPTEQKLIEMMINYLGNIQKAPDCYNLTNDESDIVSTDLGSKLGTGFHGIVYAYKLNSDQTKKKKKCLAYKQQEEGRPYTVDIHITSAILLALYDFQPKYYNLIFMEIGRYENKSKQRKFQTLLAEGKKIIEDNIKYYILFNFTNISDQVRNTMIRVLNDELIKIDIRRLNSERLYKNISQMLDYFEKYHEIFTRNKKKIIKELDKLLVIKEDFLLNLIVFRTERGCFKISKKDLAIQFDCISSSYKVLSIERNHYLSLSSLIKKCKKTYNDLHCELNPALSWMLYLFTQKNILTEKQYNDYIVKFNNKSQVFEKMAKKIRSGELSFSRKKKEHKKKSKKKDEKKKKIKSEDKKEENEEEEGSQLVLKKKNSKVKVFDKNKKETGGEIDIETEDHRKKKKRSNSMSISFEKDEKDFVKKTEELKKIEKPKKSGWSCCGSDAVDVIE